MNKIKKEKLKVIQTAAGKTDYVLIPASCISKFEITMDGVDFPQGILNLIFHTDEHKEVINDIYDLAIPK